MKLKRFLIVLFMVFIAQIIIVCKYENVMAATGEKVGTFNGKPIYKGSTQCPVCRSTAIEADNVGDILLIKATCISKGYRGKPMYCNMCTTRTFYLVTSEIKGAHQWGQWTEKKATCTTAGTKTKTCKTCGKTCTETTKNPLGHNWIYYKDEPTCTTQGSEYYKCSRCNAKKIIIAQIPSLGRSYSRVAHSSERSNL